MIFIQNIMKTSIDQSDQTEFTGQKKLLIISKWLVVDMSLVELGNLIQHMIIQLIEDIVLEEAIIHRQEPTPSKNCFLCIRTILFFKMFSIK